MNDPPIGFRWSGVILSLAIPRIRDSQWYCLSANHEILQAPTHLRYSLVGHVPDTLVN